METTYSVWYMLPNTTEWLPDLNAAGMVHANSLNMAIKAERYYQRMHGAKTKRIANSNI
jgi:hypothetical protein